MTTPLDDDLTKFIDQARELQRLSCRHQRTLDLITIARERDTVQIRATWSISGMENHSYLDLPKTEIIPILDAIADNLRDQMAALRSKMIDDTLGIIQMRPTPPQAPPRSHDDDDYPSPL